MFGRFTRNQLAHGLTYNCELLRGSAEPNPFWIMELQGGSNIYSGGKAPMVPSSQDIAQWLWSGIGCGAQRTIFWCPNSRSRGFEAGEWGMLDYQQQPTDRLKTAGRIATILKQHNDFFGSAQPAASPVTILVSLESMTLDAWKPMRDHPGRNADAHLQSVVATHLALSRLGVPARIKYVHDYSWRNKSKHPRLAILPHARALTASQAADITAFVKNGNHVLATGFTGMYDEYHRFLPLSDFPLAKLFQARVKEIVFVAPRWGLELDKPTIILPTHLWRGEIRNEGAEVIGTHEGNVVAVRSRCGQGSAVWIPSPIGLGAWLGGAEAYAELLADVASPMLDRMTFRFANPQPDAVLTVLQNKDRYVTIVTNAGIETCNVELIGPDGLKSKALWGEAAVRNGGDRLEIGPRGTVVLFWDE